jgi:hypothetical protein
MGEQEERDKLIREKCESLVASARLSGDVHTLMLAEFALEKLDDNERLEKEIAALREKTHRLWLEFFSEDVKLKNR